MYEQVVDLFELGAISIDSKGLGSASSDAFILAISSSVKIFVLPRHSTTCQPLGLSFHSFYSKHLATLY